MKLDYPDQLFIGVYPGGIVYADRGKERGGDYARLGFLPYDDLRLQLAHDCHPELRIQIVRHARGLQNRRGEDFAVDSCGHTVRLGAKLARESAAQS